VVIAAKESLLRAQCARRSTRRLHLGLRASGRWRSERRARKLSFARGAPDTVPAFTVNQACGSGLRAIILAAEEDHVGRANIVLAGGTESMSRVPYFAEGARWGTRMGHVELD
jgi:acetyl-CoA C-acetyltransferase